MVPPTFSSVIQIQFTLGHFDQPNHIGWGSLWPVLGRGCLLLKRYINQSWRETGHHVHIHITQTYLTERCLVSLTVSVSLNAGRT